MMDKLTKIALSITLCGILLILFISSRSNPELREIKNLSEKDYDKNIAIKGEIITINEYDEFQIMLIKDTTGIIKVLVNSKKPINNTDKFFLIKGKVQEYNGELELIADEISIVNKNKY